MRVRRCAVLLLPLGLVVAPTPAQAASSVCPSQPTRAQMAIVVQTLQQATRARAVTTGGLTVHAHDEENDETVAADLSAGRLRLDDVFDDHDGKRSLTRTVDDRTTSARYSDRRWADRTYDRRTPLGLSALGTQEVWVSSKLDAKTDLTEAGMLTAALQRSGLTDLAAILAPGKGEVAVDCEVKGGTLTVTTRREEEDFFATNVLALTDGGAVTGLTSSFVIDDDPKTHEAGTSTVIYADPNLPLPTPVVATKTWNAAVVQGGFDQLRTNTVKGVQALLEDSKKSQRVAVLRSVARAKAKKFWPAEATATPVADGVQVGTPKVGATGSWYFRIRNVGSGIKVTDNLP